METEGGRREEVGEHARCSCCGRTRFWTELGTFTTDISFEFDLADGTLTQTVLYCRDDSGCRGTAQTLRLIAPVAVPGDLCRVPTGLPDHGRGNGLPRSRGGSRDSASVGRDPAPDPGGGCGAGARADIAL